ncbi:reverse transcriptase domain-containing protein [Tanacetum coccineum]
MEKEKSVENNMVVDKNIVELSELDIVDPIELVDKEEEMKDKMDDELARSTNEKLIGCRQPKTYVQCNPNEKASQKRGYRRLTNKKPVGTDIRLSLASHSYIYTIGIAENVLVEIDGYVYHMDFVILDVKEDEKKPFILGTPFLTIAKAEIKFDKGTITLRSGKNKINFFKILESPCRVDEITEDEIDPVAPTNTVIFDEEKPRSS